MQKGLWPFCVVTLITIGPCNRTGQIYSPSGTFQHHGPPLELHYSYQIDFKRRLALQTLKVHDLLLHHIAPSGPAWVQLAC